MCFKDKQGNVVSAKIIKTLGALYVIVRVEAKGNTSCTAPIARALARILHGAHELNILSHQKHNHLGGPFKRAARRRVAPVVAFDALRQLVDGPLLAHAAQHGLQLILVEALQRRQRKHLRKPLPAASTRTCRLTTWDIWTSSKRTLALSTLSGRQSLGRITVLEQMCIMRTCISAQTPDMLKDPPLPPQCSGTLNSYKHCARFHSTKSVQTSTAAHTDTPSEKNVRAKANCAPNSSCAERELCDALAHQHTVKLHKRAQPVLEARLKACICSLMPVCNVASTTALM